MSYQLFTGRSLMVEIMCARECECVHVSLVGLHVLSQRYTDAESFDTNLRFELVIILQIKKVSRIIPQPADLLYRSLRHRW